MVSLPLVLSVILVAPAAARPEPVYRPRIYAPGGAAPPRDPRSIRIPTGAGLIMGGVAVLVGGIVVTTVGGIMLDLPESTTLDRNIVIGGSVAMGVGAALIAGGAVLNVRWRRATVAAAPAPGGWTAGITLRW